MTTTRRNALRRLGLGKTRTQTHGCATLVQRILLGLLITLSPMTVAALTQEEVNWPSFAFNNGTYEPTVVSTEVAARRATLLKDESGVSIVEHGRIEVFQADKTSTRAQKVLYVDVKSTFGLTMFDSRGGAATDKLLDEVSVEYQVRSQCARRDRQHAARCTARVCVDHERDASGNELQLLALNGQSSESISRTLPLRVVGDDHRRHRSC